MSRCKDVVSAVGECSTICCPSAVFHPRFAGAQHQESVIRLALSRASIRWSLHAPLDVFRLIICRPQIRSTCSSSPYGVPFFLVSHTA